VAFSAMIGSMFLLGSYLLLRRARSNREYGSHELQAGVE
jgi:hypothetical protein